LVPYPTDLSLFPTFLVHAHNRRTQEQRKKKRRCPLCSCHVRPVHVALNAAAVAVSVRIDIFPTVLIQFRAIRWHRIVIQRQGHRFLRQWGLARSTLTGFSGIRNVVEASTQMTKCMILGGVNHTRNQRCSDRGRPSNATFKSICTTSQRPSELYLCPKFLVIAIPHNVHIISTTRMGPRSEEA
jgi:hypothetical protein